MGPTKTPITKHLLKRVPSSKYSPIWPDPQTPQGTLTTRHHSSTATFVGALCGEVIKELLFHEALIDRWEFQGVLRFLRVLSLHLRKRTCQTENQPWMKVYLMLVFWANKKNISKKKNWCSIFWGFLLIKKGSSVFQEDNWPRISICFDQVNLVNKWAWRWLQGKPCQYLRNIRWFAFGKFPQQEWARCSLL